MFYAVFSPDGRQVAYGWATRIAKDIKSDLRILRLTGDESTPPRIVYGNEE